MKFKPEEFNAPPQGMDPERAEELEKLNDQPNPLKEEFCDMCGMYKTYTHKGLCRLCMREFYD